MLKKLSFLFLLGALVSSPAFSASQDHENESDEANPVSRPISEDDEDNNSEEKDISEGIRFNCKKDKLKKIEKSMQHLFDLHSIDPSLIEKKGSPEEGFLEYTLDSPKDDTNTLNLHKRSQYKLKDEVMLLPIGDGKTREVSVVSKKEILLALLQHGRLSEFKGQACTVEALKDQIGIRQNTVAWVEKIKWRWPEHEKGGRAVWNKKIWKNGTPHSDIPPHSAIADTLMHPEKYAIGCRTAAKLAMAHGILDYYANVKRDAKMVKYLNKRLLMDNDPLISIDPEFNREYTEIENQGKLLTARFNLPHNNWIPGDWGYFSNPDDDSRKKTGYEGSNAIYLGRNRFNDYYFENKGQYTFEEKMKEIYQWRDKSIQEPFTKAMEKSMAKTSLEGGIVDEHRIVPFDFGFGKVPEFNPR